MTGLAAYYDRYHQFSQEFRAVTKFDSQINFTAGLYFESVKDDLDLPIALFPIAADPATGFYENFDYVAISKSKSYSAFAQARWKLIDKVELDAGARYSHDVRDNALQNSFVNANNTGLVFTPAGHIFAKSKYFDNVSPEVTLTWTPVGDTLIYGSYRAGYKAGAAASPQLLTSSFNPATDLFYKPEKIKGFEIGAKTLQLDNRLRLTASA